MKVALPNQKLGQKNMPDVRLVTPWFIEYGFYASLVYGLLGPVVGLQIDRLGIVLLGGMACLCILGLKERPLEFFKTLVVPIGLGISYLIIQMMYHGISIQEDYVKMFIPWIFTLIIVQALSFRRGFFHRFVIFAFLLGCVLLLFLDMKEYGTEGVTRLALEKGVGLSNSNALADWFGFCAVYFYIFGMIAARQKNRMISWIIAIGCLFVVTLTVSRGALMASLFAIALGSREFLKRGFLPVLLLLIIVWIAYGTGMFDKAITFYTIRATEESGRFLVWPRAFENFLNAPFSGVGANEMGIFVPEKAKTTTPHNGFLFIAMASGIFPLIFYAAYWIQATLAALRASPGKTKPTSFLLPLVAYAFLVCFASNAAFMNPYVVVTLAAALTSSIPSRQAPSKIPQIQTYKKRIIR